jgi:8-oxo-dGTP diphosphatase
MSSSEPVLAAGGVVIRDGLVLVVHRPRYDDWSLPKGKLEPGEDAQTAALREVREETGLRCELHEELAPDQYVDDKGRPKVVRWWHMSVLAEEGQPDDEVDALRWISPQDANALLDYDHDRALVARLLA